MGLILRFLTVFQKILHQLENFLKQLNQAQKEAVKKLKNSKIGSHGYKMDTKQKKA